MTDPQWEQLLRVLDGERLDPLPVAFIIDSPWLPGWAGCSILDYYASQPRWLEANFRAVRQFPDVVFLPGFWSEFGMCTEPSAFGAKCVFADNDFPFAEKVLHCLDDVDRLARPNCRTDGLCPFVVKRLEHCRGEIEAAGHRIRFAVSRGPLNIASFLAGHTELLIALKTEPAAAVKLIDLVTDFGKIADPIADKALMAAAMISLSLVHELFWWVTVVILVREVGITVWRLVGVDHVVAASKGGKLKTATQTLGVGMLILPLPHWVWPVEWFVMGVAVVLTAYSGIDYLVKARQAAQQ